MATPKALKALQDTQQALIEIRDKVQPLLDILRESSSTDNPHNVDKKEEDHVHRVAVARVGIAMTLGTLQLFAQRLQGHKPSDPSKDPIRLELNRLRKTLVQVQQKATTATTTPQTTGTTGTAGTTKRKSSTTTTDDKPKKKEGNLKKNKNDTITTTSTNPSSPSSSGSTTPAAKRRRLK
jgi:hypothetical protein